MYTQMDTVTHGIVTQRICCGNFACRDGNTLHPLRKLYQRKTVCDNDFSTSTQSLDKQMRTDQAKRKDYVTVATGTTHSHSLTHSYTQKVNVLELWHRLDAILDPSRTSDYRVCRPFIIIIILCFCLLVRNDNVWPLIFDVKFLLENQQQKQPYTRAHREFACLRSEEHSQSLVCIERNTVGQCSASAFNA